MKILVDTNIILDIVLEREPFFEQAERLLQITHQSSVEIFLTATTVTDLYYIIRKAKDRDVALNFVGDLLQFVEIASVDKNVILQALQLDITDFEDAVQASSASNEGISIIITRNEADFSNSNLEVLTPELFLKRLG